MPGCAYWRPHVPNSPRRRRVFWSTRRWRWWAMWVGWRTTRTPTTTLPIRRHGCGKLWRLRFLGLADSISAQVGEVSDQSDGAQAAGLLTGEAQPEHVLDAAVGVDVLAGVAWERRLGDRLEQSRAGEVGQSGPGQGQTRKAGNAITSA